ncbi:site-specific integrase [Sinomonas sp. JGH33]|uniref:Site-specific integrase n=1 Tax=Sinomonas terricola TaxID=3110330 RepID=A0ABU5TAS3_9MICC|nr:site-specific integrase [Sinomonas sp. JGH33]MEA5456795.1 site-specific integrase [Sinomonas sp. JGH33]
MSESPVVWKVFFAPDHIDLNDDELLCRALCSVAGDDDPSGVWLSWAGRPIFLDGSGVPHTALNGFFAGAKMRNRAASTNKRYAYTLSVWVNFLAARGKVWDSAVENDVMDFKFWRRSDARNPRRVSGSAWANDLAALATFYDWARRVLGGPSLFAAPELAPKRQKPFAGSRPTGSDLRPATVRGADVKWLSPRAYARWRDVGIHGLTPKGAERARWRPRSQSRDAAFVDGLYGCGLRLQEWASVLVLEVDRAVAGRQYAASRLADACAKGGRGHSYWLRGDVLDQVAIYKESERAAAVRSGHASGLYEGLPRRMVIEEARNGLLRVSTFQSRTSFPSTVQVNDLSPEERLRLMVRTEDGLEPAALWLNEDGSPRQKSAWYKAFDRANARVRKAGIERLECHPHMLRHSFALRWFAVGRLIWSQQVVGMDAEQQRDLREQFGDTWSLVQTMLGHADVNTHRGQGGAGPGPAGGGRPRRLGSRPDGPRSRGAAARRAARAGRTHCGCPALGPRPARPFREEPRVARAVAQHLPERS